MHETPHCEGRALARQVAGLSAMSRSVAALVADLERELRFAAQAVEAPVGPEPSWHRAHIGRSRRGRRPGVRPRR